MTEPTEFPDLFRRLRAAVDALETALTDLVRDLPRNGQPHPDFKVRVLRLDGEAE